MIKQNKQTKIVKIYISNVDYHSEQQFSSMTYDQNKNNRLACKDREPQFQQNKCLQQQHLKQCICLKKRGAYSGKGTAKQAFPAWDMIKHHQTSMKIQKNHNFNEISCLQQQPSNSSSTETQKKKASILQFHHQMRAIAYQKNQKKKVQKSEQTISPTPIAILPFTARKTPKLNTTKKKKKECNTEAGSSGGGQEGAHLVRGREESMASEIGAYGARRERRRRGQEEEDAPTSQTPRPHLLLCTELKRWAAMAVGFLGAEIGGSGRGGAHGDGSPPLSPDPPAFTLFQSVYVSTYCWFLVSSRAVTRGRP